MSESKVPLGRLQPIRSLREVWPDESVNFTPWLARPENLSLLAEAIGFGTDGLEFVDREVPVGPFFADMLCHDTRVAEPRNVVIENQLTKSDHDHLGKVITYASVLEADYVIVVADKIREEHRTALEWLNYISKDRFGFFAVEIELWRIGDSLIAPKFEVVVMPDEWLRQAQQLTGQTGTNEPSETGLANLRYWSAFCDHHEVATGGERWPRSPHPRNYLGTAIGRTNFEVNCVFNRWENWLRVELTMYGPNAQDWLHSLKEDQKRIEAEIGNQLTWDFDAARTKQHIQLQLSDVQPDDESNWPQQHKWMSKNALSFLCVFEDRVAALPSNYETAT